MATRKKAAKSAKKKSARREKSVAASLLTDPLAIVQDLIDTQTGVLGKDMAPTRYGDTHDPGSAVKLWVPSGHVGLDAALGGRGWPTGRIIELYAPNGTGKSSLMVLAMRELQRLGGIASLWDIEGTTTDDYLALHGVETGRLIRNKAQTLERVRMSMESQLIRAREQWDLSKCPFGMFWDSRDATPLEMELEIDPDDEGDVQAVIDKASHMHRVRASKLAQMFRNISARLAGQPILFMFTDQVMTKTDGYGNQSLDSGGGEKKKHYCGVRVELSHRGMLRDRDAGVAWGQTLQAEMQKTKVGIPHAKALMTLAYGRGIVEVFDYLRVFAEAGLATQNGTFFELPERKLGEETVPAKSYQQGTFLKKYEDDPLFQRYVALLCAEIRERAMPSVHVPVVAQPAAPPPPPPPPPPPAEVRTETT